MAEIPGTADIAVAVAEDGTAVFATSDGLGHLPTGARAARDVVPLAVFATEEFIAQWLGCDVPHRALVAAIEAGIIPPAVDIGTTSQGITEPGVASLDLSALAIAPRAPLATSREEFTPFQIDDPDEALAELTAQLGAPATDLDEARTAAEGLRWMGATDPRYAVQWGRYLHAAAAAALASNDLGSARYLLGSALLAASAQPAARS